MNIHKTALKEIDEEIEKLLEELTELEKSEDLIRVPDLKKMAYYERNCLTAKKQGYLLALENTKKIIDDVDLKVMFTDIKNKKGKKIPESDEVMKICDYFWHYIKDELLKELEIENSQTQENE